MTSKIDIAIVCGGRTYVHFDKVCDVLDSFGPSFVILGGATGADQLALEWAEMRKVSRAVFNANWALHGKSAGPIRNMKMLKCLMQGKVDDQKIAVIAFPGGRGTENMVNVAMAAGVPVYKILEDVHVSANEGQ